MFLGESENVVTGPGPKLILLTLILIVAGVLALPEVRWWIGEKTRTCARIPGGAARRASSGLGVAPPPSVIYALHVPIKRITPHRGDGDEAARATWGACCPSDISCVLLLGYVRTADRGSGTAV
jgi:hypothetical protein